MTNKHLHLERALRAALFVLLLSAVRMPKGYAYDFSAVCSTGQTLYYNITDAENYYVELTCPGTNQGNAWNGYAKPTGNIILPDSVEYDGNVYSVTSIGDNAFFLCSGLSGNLIIPNSVTTIGNYSFYYCSHLISLTLSNSLVSTGEKSFYRCDGLRGGLVIPNTMTSTGEYSFSYCSRLSSLTLGNSITTIGAYSFSYCEGLTGDLVIPNTVTTIDNCAFSGCSGFTSTLTIPNSVTSIGSGAFSGCSGFTGTLTIPSSVTSICGSTFSNCSGFTGTLTIPNSVTSIGDYAFNNCRGLTGNLTIPNSVISIGNYAFNDCLGLTSLTIGNFVTTIGNCAFSRCKYLTSVTIGNSVTTIGNSAFSGCSDLISMTIPNSVTSIGNYTFDGCSSLASLTIGSSVASLGYYFLRGCNNLTSLTVLADNPPILGYYYEFYNTPTTIIYVPCSSVGLYQSTNGWRISQNIIGMCASGTITVAADPLEGGTVVGGGTYEGGTPCTVIATANDGYTFMYWTENNTVVSALPEYGFAVPTNRNLVAHFTLPLNVNVVANPTEGGTVTGTGEYDYGSICTVTSTPNENYTFLYWTKNGAQISTQPTCSFKVTSDSELEANFALPFDVTASTNLHGCGTISGTGEYDYGSICTLTATPDEGYLFLNWSKNGEVISCDASYSFSVTEDIILEAVFMEFYYGVLVGDTGGGPAGWIADLPYCSNSSYTLSQQIYTSDEIGEIGSISSISFFNGCVEGEEIPWVGPGPDPWDKGSLFNTENNARNLDIYMVHTDKTVFNSNTDWISVTEADLVFSGNVSLIPGYWTTIFLDTMFYYNGTSNLAIIVDDNTGGYTENYSSCRVFDAQSNQTISVYYGETNYDPSNPSLYDGFLSQEKNQIIFNAPSWYYIGASWNNGGTAEGGAQMYPPLTICTLTATPNDGYVFLNWTENDQIVSTDTSYSFVVVGSRYLSANFMQISNHWTPNENDYEDNMTFTCVVQLDGVEQRSTRLELGAFCGEECRGSQLATYFAPTDRYIYQMMVFGESNDMISFRLYDHQLQQELLLFPPASVTFNSNGYGSLGNPYVLNFTGEPSETTQTTELSEGWNWFSTYIAIEDPEEGMQMLQAALGENGLKIMSMDDYTTYEDGAWGAMGDLEELENEQTYMILTSAACTVELQGVLANPSDYTITIKPGWNWIGFPSAEVMSVEEAFANFEAAEGDKIMTEDDYTTYEDGVWGAMGDLEELTPGQGLKYYSASTETKTLVFPAKK